MSSEAVIVARGLSKAYRIYRRPGDRLKERVLRRRYHEDFWAVRDVDLTVSRGETVGLIGRNGSGKSTLLQLICGTVRPTRGEVEVRGRVGALLELGAGFNPEFTGRENVWVNAAVLGLSDREIAARFDAIAAFAGIGEYMDQPVKHYSSGMFARLAFSVCVHVDADVLVVDEALSVGDAAFQQKCMRHLYASRQQGALVFVSHDLPLVSKLCDRVLWLERGTVRAEGSAREVCRLYEAALSSESAEDKDGFRTGGRGWRGTEIVTLRGERPGTASGVTVDFDPDALLDEAGGGVIERIGVYAAGAPVRTVSGNEEVELRIEGRAVRSLAEPTVGFMVRDRLGQGLFGDHTHGAAGTERMTLEAGRSFTASFRFRFPYLFSGEYSLEAAVYEGPPERNRLVARLRDSAFLLMQSPHPGGGLVNILMNAVTLTVDDAAPAPALVSTPETVPAKLSVWQP